MVKVLLVGSGVTAATFLHYCRRLPWLEKKVDFHIFEALSSVGGRMMTVQGSGELSSLRADMGAQYLTQYHTESQDIFDYLEEKQIIQKFDASNGIIHGVKEKYSKLPHYRIPNGINDIVESLIRENTENCRLNTRVLSVELLRSSVRVQSSSKGNIMDEEFDYVITTIPAPNLLELHGNILELLIQQRTTENLRNQLKQVDYSRRFGLALFCTLPKDQFLENVDSLKSKAQYIYDTPIIRYVSFEQWKSTDTTSIGIESSTTDHISFSILIHTTVPFAQSFLNNDGEVVFEKNSVIRLILTELTLLYPQISWSTCIKDNYLQYWNYSQIISSFPKQDLFWSLNSPDTISPSSERILLCGEMFTESVFEGCVKSAKAAAHYFHSLLEKQSH